MTRLRTPSISAPAGSNPSDTGDRFAGCHETAGTPKAVFHGTTAAFDEFKIGHEGAVFFAANEATAAFYAQGAGGRVLARELELRRPLEMTEREWRRGVTDAGLNHYLEGASGLVSMGFDGMVIHPDDTSDPALSSTVYAVFSVDQIKIPAAIARTQPPLPAPAKKRHKP